MFDVPDISTKNVEKTIRQSSQIFFFLFFSIVSHDFHNRKHGKSP